MGSVPLAGFRAEIFLEFALFAFVLVGIGRRFPLEDVAEAVVWLLSDAASYVTATILPVAGGR